MAHADIALRSLFPLAASVKQKPTVNPVGFYLAKFEF
jgi:hypothetical protein